MKNESKLNESLNWFKLYPTYHPTFFSSNITPHEIENDCNILSSMLLDGCEWIVRIVPPGFYIIIKFYFNLKEKCGFVWPKKIDSTIQKHSSFCFNKEYSQAYTGFRWVPLRQKHPIESKLRKVAVSCLTELLPWNLGKAPLSNKNASVMNPSMIYSVNLRIQSKYRKIRTRKTSAFGHFSCSGNILNFNWTAYNNKQKDPSSPVVYEYCGF